MDEARGSCQRRRRASRWRRWGSARAHDLSTNMTLTSLGATKFASRIGSRKPEAGSWQGLSRLPRRFGRLPARGFAVGQPITSGAATTHCRWRLRGPQCHGRNHRRGCAGAPAGSPRQRGYEMAAGAGHRAQPGARACSTAHLYAVGRATLYRCCAVTAGRRTRIVAIAAVRP